MNNKEEIKLSKYLSYILRHNPSEIDLDVDKSGWALLSELIEKSAQKNTLFTKEDVFFVVKNNSKQRFVLSEDGNKIKAHQGHSIQVELNLLDIKPPEYLFHGTSESSLESILKEGLKPMKRHDVHLSFTETIAYNVGKRYGVPVILKVDTEKMFQDGYLFQCTPNNVWLTKEVPSIYIEVLNEKK